jgi:hypothetical protein
MASIGARCGGGAWTDEVMQHSRGMAPSNASGEATL